MLRRASRWFSKFSNSAFDVKTPPLEANEYVIRDEGGILVKGPFVGNTGRLILTNQRLIFLSVRLRPSPRVQALWPRLAICLSEIERIAARGWFRHFRGSMPGMPALTVELADGTKFTFQSRTINQWWNEIERARREAESTD